MYLSPDTTPLPPLPLMTRRMHTLEALNMRYVGSVITGMRVQEGGSVITCRFARMAPLQFDRTAADGLRVNGVSTTHFGPPQKYQLSFLSTFIKLFGAQSDYDRLATFQRTLEYRYRGKRIANIDIAESGNVFIELDDPAHMTNAPIHMLISAHRKDRSYIIRLDGLDPNRDEFIDRIPPEQLYA